MPVAGHDHRDIDAVIATPLVAASDCATDTLIVLVLDQHHAPRCVSGRRTHDFGRPVATAIVDDDDSIDEFRSRIDDPQNLRLLVVGWHDDADAAISVHDGYSNRSEGMGSGGFGRHRRYRVQQCGDDSVLGLLVQIGMHRQAQHATGHLAGVAQRGRHPASVLVGRLFV